MTEINIDKCRDWIGSSQCIDDAIDVFPARALAAALDDEQEPKAGDPLAPLWHWLYFKPTIRASELGEDGHPQKGGFLPPIPLARRMWASGNVEFKAPLRIGKSAQRTSTVDSVELKEGRTGPLVFVTVDHQIFQDGLLCISEEQRLVYRDAPQKGAQTPPAKKPEFESQFSRRMTADPVLLFRYSALTYNAHRIHYDRPYAQNEEDYPGLVVHGPLLATLLARLGGDHARGKKMNSFRFRAMSPTFEGRPFELIGAERDNTIMLSTIDHEGGAGMQAEAVLS